jgi:asparagine synthase (glutamine-hydrolysing)
VCGIFGVINLDGAPAQMADLRSMADRMIHRGPDDEGFWIEGSVGIGMRRLSIIDLAGGHQPIGNETGDVQVVLNGEIYNFKELRRDLLGRGHRFASGSDAEVLVHLYEEMGRECIHALNGMFAFALYDRRKSSLWLARDRLGIKPLYFSLAGSCFLFSSELSALNAVAGASVSPAALAIYLAYSYFPAPLTPYANVCKLLPGEEIVIEGGQVSQRRYWRLSGVGERELSPAGAIGELEALLTDSVLLERQSDVPLGIFLSGGVDSSALAAFAAAQTAGVSIRTFTINFVGKTGEDAQYAKQASQRIHSDHNVIDVTAEEQFSALQELMPFLDEPIADSAIVPTYILSRRARELGVKVLLSGAGGDEIFGGYPRHFPGQVARAAWFASLPPLMRAVSSRIWGAWDSALAIRLANPARNFAVTISGTNLAFLRQAFRSTAHFDGVLERYESDFGSGAAASGAYPKMRLDLEHYLPDNILPLLDKATMAASVEGRVPLLDHRLVEFAFSLPERINILNGREKGLFREMLKPHLPTSILDRSKEGFNAPISRWVEQWPEVIRHELLYEASPMLKDLLDFSVVKEWLDDSRLRRQGGGSLYSLFVLNRWLRTHAPSPW